MTDYADCFPMPLSAYEHHMLALDQIYPATNWAVFHFTGHLERSVLETAIRYVWPRFPLLQATIRGSPKKTTNRIFWELTPQDLPYIGWCSDEAPWKFPNGDTRIHIDHEPGLRLFIRNSARGSSIYFQIHHCCMDGIRIMHFVETLFKAYHAVWNNTPNWPRLPQSNKEHLLKRDQLQPAYQVGMKKLATIPRRLIDVNRHSIKHFAMRAPPKQFPEWGSADPPLYSRNCGPYFLNRIKKLSHSQGVSLNDLFITALFKTLLEYFASEAAIQSHKWLRISMATDIRHYYEFPDAYANTVSGYRLEIPLRETYFNNILQTVSQQNHRAKTDHTDLNFIYLIKQIGRIPHGMNWMMQNIRQYPTLFLSNMGRVLDNSPLFRNSHLRFANLTLHDLELYPPLAICPLIVLIASHNNVLKINCHYDSRIFSRREIEHFTQRFQINCAGSSDTEKHRLAIAI